MAGPKPPDDEEEELCVNCGMPPCKVDPTIPITLLFSKATRQVLCLEAGKDFVDTLMGFLTLPVGCIIKLLEEATMIHRPECKIAPPLSPSPTFPPGTPYTLGPKKGGNESGEHFSMSSISNIFGSVVRLDNREMSSNKNCLVDPKPLTSFGAGKLLDLHDTPRSSTDRSTTSSGLLNYYGCGNACSFYTTNPATKCPKHKKKMGTPFKIVEPGHAGSGGDASNPGDANSQEQPDSSRTSQEPRGRKCVSDKCASKHPIPIRASSRLSVRPLTAKSSAFASKAEGMRRPSTSGADMQLTLPPSPAPSMNPKGDGYVKEGTQYMITNTLEIHASSEAIRALITLNIIRCERVGDLDTMPVSVVTSEMLQLLKSSFTSTDVLNDVFGKYCADVKSVVFEEKKEAFFPQCAEKPCCQCSRMGTPMKGEQGVRMPNNSSGSAGREWQGHL